MDSIYIDLFVPGRLCLFGEHSDWAGGYRRVNAEIIRGMAIVTGIEQGIKARVTKASTLQIFSAFPDGSKTDFFEVPMDVKALKSIASGGGFFSYAAGVAAYVLEHYQVEGVCIECYEMTLPMKKGLSSSAAICVLVARTFNILYNLQLNARGEMEIAYRGEILTPSRCGRMDQVCAYGKKPILMTFDGDSIDVEPVKVAKPMYWVFADLNKGKNTKKILADLNQSYPFAQSGKDKDVQSALGDLNQGIVKRVIAAMEKGESQTVGVLMNEAQSVFDKMVMPASPLELASPKLHFILEDSHVKELTWGGKGVGSQGDGTIQFITRGKQEQAELIEYLKKEHKLTAYPFELNMYQTVQKAVVPLAGYGTRLFPASKAVKKELFPIIDKDGIAKPALLILLEELDQAGIDQICLIIAEGEENLYKGLFEFEPNKEYTQKLPAYMREYDQRIRRIGKKIKYVYQKERLGFGHAVFQSREFANNEPVLLVLGDHIFKSTEERCCAAQAVDAFKLSGGLTVLLQEVPLNQVSHYGIISGLWIDDGNTQLSVSEMYEKPTEEYAEENLGVKMRNGETKYFSVFGQYIITPDVYDILERNIKNGKIERGEFQLTSALDEVRELKGMFAYVPKGKRFDIGIPEAYRNTVWSYLE